MKFLLLSCIIAANLVKISKSSAGDHSPYYQKCVDKCVRSNCTADGLNFDNNYEQPIYLSLLAWNCLDECEYECMWKTVDAFHQRKWNTPQFYGKWPFIRIFGMQEPASVLFSILNFYAHALMLRKFQKEFSSETPLYWLWHLFSFVSLNSWLWSAVFHARDFSFTELMDYAGAFSMVLISCYCMVIRLLRKSPKFILVTITVFLFAFFINHLIYLSMGRFDYGYNMQLNIILGTFTAICWFAWCTYNRIRQPYVWKCAVFVALTGLVMLLEIIDIPPFFYIFDCHSLWHLSTAPLTCLFYSFIIDDCRYLCKQEVKSKRD